jgi:hypothetical protein
MMAPSFAWKLVLAITLASTIFLSARARAPRQTLAVSDLRLLVSASLLLYGVGVACAIVHHPILAVVAFSGGIAVSALTAWLSRGVDSDGPPPPEEPADDGPPPFPDGTPGFDWAAFERELRTYEGRRARDRVPVA